MNTINGDFFLKKEYQIHELKEIFFNINFNWCENIYVKLVSNVLYKNNIDHRFVGGIVRDSLLGKTTYDIDIAVYAPPSDIFHLLEKEGFSPVPTGIDHGTVSLFFEENFNLEKNKEENNSEKYEKQEVYICNNCEKKTEIYEKKIKFSNLHFDEVNKTITYIKDQEEKIEEKEFDPFIINNVNNSKDEDFAVGLFDNVKERNSFLEADPERINKNFSSLTINREGLSSYLKQVHPYNDGVFPIFIPEFSCLHCKNNIVNNNIELLNNSNRKEREEFFYNFFEKNISNKGGFEKKRKWSFEITSLRKDVETYGRRAKVVFGGTWQDDCERRDFTINALMFDIKTFILYDYWNGIKDLEKGLIRFIGNSEKRIEEDYLRIMRYIRFFCRFAKEKDLETERIIKEKSHNLIVISKERILKEIEIILGYLNWKEGLVLLKELNIDKILWGEEIIIPENDYIPYEIKPLIIFQKVFIFRNWPLGRQVKKLFNIYDKLLKNLPELETCQEIKKTIVEKNNSFPYDIINSNINYKTNNEGVFMIQLINNLANIWQLNREFNSLKLAIIIAYYVYGVDFTFLSNCSEKIYDHLIKIIPIELIPQNLRCVYTQILRKNSLILPIV